jgi:hypothetical protein
VAVLVFLPAPAGTGIVAPDLRASIGRLLCGVSPLQSYPAPRRNRHVVLDVLDIGVRRGFLDIFRRTNLHGEDDTGHFLADLIEQALEQARKLHACIPASGSSARNRAGECPDADDPAPPDVRASAYRGSAASHCARTGGRNRFADQFDLGQIGLIGLLNDAGKDFFVGKRRFALDPFGGWCRNLQLGQPACAPDRAYPTAPRPNLPAHARGKYRR